MWTHIFNSDALHSKTAEHFLQKQCTVCAAFADVKASFLERLSGQSLFPWFRAFFLLCRFRAATFHWLLRNQTRHIERWLTSVKFRCKVDVHWFNKLFWPIRTACILQPQKWLQICKCQRTITPHQHSTMGFAGNEFAFIHIAISILSGNSVSVFWEMRAYIHTTGRFLY